MNHLIAQELALYLGCDVCMYADSLGILQEVKVDKVAVVNKASGRSDLLLISEVKPILRRMSSMTEKECRALCKLEGWGWDLGNMVVSDDGIHFQDKVFRKITPESFRYLLSLHFDLFGWIDSGKALDKATL